MKNWKRNGLILVGVIILVSVVGLVARGRGQPQAPAQEGAKAQPVKVAPVETGDVILAHETTGTVAAATEADVAAKVEQRIVSLPYREGDPVQASAVLACLEDTEARRQVQMAEAEARVARAQLRDLLAGSRPQEIAQARATYEQARATEAKAAHAWRHAQEVYGQGGLPEQTIAAAEAKVQVARAQVETATANLDNARSNYRYIKEQVELDAEPRLRVQEAQGRLRTAEAQVAAAQTSVSDAERDLDRVTEMKRIGGASQEAVDKAQARLETARAQLRVAEASRDTAREGLDRAEEIYKLRAQPQQQLEDARTKQASAEAQLKAARESLQAAETDLSHVRRLYSGPIPQRELDDARARLSEAQAAAEAARQRLALLEEGASSTQIMVARERVQQAEAKVAAARVTLSYCTVRAPLSGTVVRRYLDVGDMAGPRTPLLTLATAGHLVVKAGISDRYAGQLFTGAPVTVTAAILDKPLALTVTRVYRSADPKTRLMPFEASLPSGTRLPVGSLVQVRLVLEKAVGVPVVPSDALLARLGGKRVAFVVEQDKTVLRSVVVGLEADGKAEIREGLRVGEQLVVSGQEMLRDKMPVKVGDKGKAGAKPGPSGPAGSSALSGETGSTRSGPSAPQAVGQAAPKGESR